MTGAVGGGKAGTFATAGGEVVTLGPVLAAGEVNTSSGSGMTTLFTAGEGGTLSACSKAGGAAKTMGESGKPESDGVLVNDETLDSDGEDS